MNTKESELLIAIEKSVLNSEELIADADLLKENDRIPRAYTLYQLAIEEVGKAMDIYGSIVLGLVESEGGQKKLAKNFKDHVAKAQGARMFNLIYIVDLMKRDRETGEKLLEWTLQEMQGAQILNNYKNYSLYTSFIDNTYKMPKEIITLGRLNYIELMAKTRVKLAKSYLDLSLQNLDELKEYAKNNSISVEKGNELIKNFVEQNFPKDILIKVWGDAEN